MAIVPDATESLLDRTKKLLEQRGPSLSLRQIADGAGVGHQWLRSFLYGGRIKEPGVSKIERVHNFLTDYKAAQRFHRSEEARAS